MPKVEQIVQHNLVIDNDMATGTGNHHFIGFYGNDVMFVQFTEPTSHQWRFSTDGHIYFRNRHDWVNWDAWQQKL